MHLLRISRKERAVYAPHTYVETEMTLRYANMPSQDRQQFPKNFLKENERVTLRDIGESIARHRDEKDLSQRELADAVGTTQTSIRRMEKGQTNTSVVVLVRTFKVLAMDMMKLLDAIEPRSKLIEDVYEENREYIEQATAAMGLGEIDINTKRTLMEMLDIWEE